MKANLILHTKEIHADEVVEIKIWKVPVSPDKPHGVKISLVYIKEKKRIVGYDNAEGKGYHRHFSDKEELYNFTDIWRLIADFKNDILKIRGRDWDED